MTQVAALARVHRRDQLKTRGKIRLVRGARDGDAARFERLAQHLEHVTAEFGKLVEKEDAMMREAYFSRAWVAPAADQSGR